MGKPRLKAGITSKLFFAILFTCALVALAMAGAMRYSFDQGFLGYLNEQEAQRIEALRPSLVQAYQEHGNWDFLRDKPRLWFSLIRPPGMDAGKREDAGRPARRAPPESDLTGLSLRISLLDADKALVIGNPAAATAATLKPIEVEGRTVGWVAVLPFQQVSTSAEMRFQQQQTRASWLIGAIAILLAAIAALLLARMLLAPVKRIAASTHQLAAGDYSARVPVSSGDELGQLARDFNHLALSLEKNEQLRRAFMADVSHELRTPLSVLKGELEAIEDGIRPMSLAMVQSLQAEVATLGKLVNDLYELSLSDAGALAYRKTLVDIEDVLRQTLEAFGPRFAQKAITARFDATGGRKLVCHADPDRLRQLFNNLLENTLRYTDTGGQLVIVATGEGGTARLNFQDSAPGVPEDRLARLFERFYRVEGSRSRATGGAGLGLAISRNIAEAHQGCMAAQASPLGGVRITLTLPLAEGAAS